MARRKFGFHGQPVGLARAHGRLEDFDAVAADALGVIHRQLGVFEHLLGAVRLLLGERQADRGGEEDFAVVEGDRRAQRAPQRLGEGDDARRLLLRQQDQRELVAAEPRQRVLRLEQAGEPARDGEQHGIADRDADRIVDLLEAVEIDHQHRRPDLRVGAGIGEGRFHAVEEQFAVGQAGEIVVHRVEQQPLLGLLEVVDVGERADQPHHFAVGADHRPRLQREPEIIAVVGAQAEILREAAAPLLDRVVERGAEAVAVERVQHVEPARGRAFQRAALQAQNVLGFRAGEHFVGGHVPIPDHVAGARQRERAPFDVRHDAVRDAAGEGVLHHRKSDQHHDQHQAAEQRRADNVVGDDAGDGKAGAEGPHHQQQPGRDQQHRAVEAVGREIDHQRQPEHRDQRQRHARDAGGDGRVEHRDADQRGERDQPGDGDVGIAHVPARQVQVGEQEHQQRRRQDRLAAGAPDALGAGRHVEHLAPEAEVDADIDQHRPAERRGGREHDRAFDHEQNGEEEREQTGDADDDAVIERERVDLVLVGVRLPQIDLRQLVGAQLGDQRDDGAGIERDAENVGAGAFLPHRPVARRRRDGGDARQAEVGPEQAGADHAVMRHDDQPVDLFVAVVGEREHRPVGVALARAHLDAAHDAVGSRRGGDLDAVGLGFEDFGGGGEVDGGGIEPHIDGFDRARRRRRQREQHQCSGGQPPCHDQTKTPGASPRAKIRKQHAPIWPVIAPISRLQRVE